MSDIKDNPFTALFNSVNAAEQYRNESKELEKESGICERLEVEESKKNEISLLEKILLLSTDPEKDHLSYVYMENVPLLSCETADVILFERLMLSDPLSCIKTTKRTDELEEAGRNEVIVYLYEVYQRCYKLQHVDSMIAQQIQTLVIANLATALEQPDVFIGQNPKKQFQTLILDLLPGNSILSNLLKKLFTYCDTREEISYLAVFEEIITEADQRLKKCSLLSIDWNMLEIIDFCSTSFTLSSIILRSPKGMGRKFQTENILGTLLSISCLPKQFRGEDCEFFEEPSSQPLQSHKATEHSIAVAQSALNNRLLKIVRNFLKSTPESRDLFLRWVEECLESNSARGGVWHIQTEELRNVAFVGDGFMINLASILLKLCSPFTKDVFNTEQQNYKIMKVDPAYCSQLISEKSEKVSGWYPADIPKQTMLIPLKEDSGLSEVVKNSIPEQFSFTTTCFFLAQRAFNLGIQVAYQKIFKLSQELGRLQHEYEEVSGQASEGVEMIRKHMESRTTLFLSYKAAVFNSSLVDDVLEFLAATSLWITQLAFKTSCRSSISNYKEITLEDLSKPENQNDLGVYLQHIPEFIVENMVEAIIAINRYSSETLVLSGEVVLKFFMSFVAVFMGSTTRMNNPHLRAHLAECLETLIPKENNSMSIVSGVRDRLFIEHPLAKNLSRALIHVFVSIEMTGQSVAFEEKFNYRRPMYEVMKYLWGITQHRKEFVNLATYALKNMESANPPLFLRFVNLLINDAIFLLDEGLSYMTQIRENQLERESEAWNALTPEQQSERERNVRQSSLLARFHNMLGSKTIQTLIMLSNEIPQMFTHPTLVDRIAAMLNHFLNHLVGRKQRNLKVKDMEKYEFRPSEIVSDICTIYINLSKISEFCRAVSGDDRSYSPQLFNQACNVLTKIGRLQLKYELEIFGQTVEEANKKKLNDEDLVASAPDHFVDPIMLHVMSDPVRLPSSKMVVDRQTIARHLLSDQTDPFNRQPLTMEQILAEEELKKEIEDWIAEQKINRDK